MQYLLGVILPALLQVMLIYILIQANTGNGSFAGLGALLIGMVAVPLTLLLNTLYLRNNSGLPVMVRIVRCFLIALLAPLLSLLLMLF